GIRAAVEQRDSVLRSAAHREARPDGLGAGPVHLRREPRGRAREAAVRPVLHQAHVGEARPLHHLRDGEDGGAAARRLMHMLRTPAPLPEDDGRIVNAMTIDVEDYFHVSVFDGLVPRHSWGSMESRVVGNTERILEMFEEEGVRGTFFVLGWVA